MYPVISEIAKRLVKFIDENAKNGEETFELKEVSKLRFGKKPIYLFIRMSAHKTIYWRCCVQLHFRFGFQSF